MKTVIVYDTVAGNTEQMARQVATALEAFGPVSLYRAEDAQPAMIAAADLLVVGCPTQDHTTTPRLAAFLRRLSPEIVREVALAIFDTRYHLLKIVVGSGGDVLAAQIERMGGRLLVPVKSFYIEEHKGWADARQLEQAKRWAYGLAAAYDQRRLFNPDDPQPPEDWAGTIAHALTTPVFDTEPE
jgi:flavodoxin